MIPAEDRGESSKRVTEAALSPWGQSEQLAAVILTDHLGNGGPWGQSGLGALREGLGAAPR